MTKYITRSGWQQQRASLLSCKKKLHKVYRRWPQEASSTRPLTALENVDAAIDMCDQHIRLLEARRGRHA